MPGCPPQLKAEVVISLAVIKDKGDFSLHGLWHCFYPSICARACIALVVLVLVVVDPAARRCGGVLRNRWLCPPAIIKSRLLSLSVDLALRSRLVPVLFPAGSCSCVLVFLALGCTGVPGCPPAIEG